MWVGVIHIQAQYVHTELGVVETCILLAKETAVTLRVSIACIVS